MRLVQIANPSFGRRAALVEDSTLHLLGTHRSIYAFARVAIDTGCPLQELILSDLSDVSLDYDEVYSLQSDWNFLPSFDHPDVIAGQGTVAAVLCQQAGPLDSLFVCLGGGGLLAGSMLSAGALSPHCKVYGVEPEAGNDGQRSLSEGRIVRIEVPRTIADGAQTQGLGRHTFEIIRRDVAGILTVSDAELIDCMRFFASRLKIVVEPTGCLGFAAVRALGDGLRGQRVGVIVSGGNVDAARYGALLAGSDATGLD